MTTHLASECDQIPQPKRCHHCKSEDHLIGDCPLRVAYLLLEDEENNAKSKTQKSELKDKVDLNNELNCKEELENVLTSVEQSNNQKSQTLNKEQAKENFLDKTTASLINYKKLKKKKKSTSSLSNASFSSSSSELSSSISSKSVSPCPFTHLPNYSTHTNEQQMHYSLEEPRYYYDHYNDHYREESYIMNNQTVNQMNNGLSNQTFPNYVEENLNMTNNSIPYYDHQFYLPVNYNNNFNTYSSRLNQISYNGSNQINQQPFNSYYDSVSNSSFYKVCTSPYDDYHSQLMNTPISNPINSINSSQDNHLNYCNYQTNQFQLPMPSQTNKLIFPNQFNSFNNNLVRLNNCNLDSFNTNCFNTSSCCNCYNSNSVQKLSQFNCQSCEDKLKMNHCSMILNSCNDTHCTNHTHQSNHICDLNQIMNHNCCNLNSNHFCKHSCKISTCSCLPKCKSVHTKNSLTCQFSQSKLDSCCCNQFLNTNLIKKQMSKKSDCELQKVNGKKVLDHFETDSGVESGSTRCTTSRCSTATGLEIE